VLEALHFNSAPYSVGVDVQGLCDGADFPMFGVEVAANLYTGFGRVGDIGRRMGVFSFLWRISERIITFRKDVMPDSINALEADRAKLLEDFLRLGDLRPGSITAVVRRCGKPSCHCAKPNDPGHDPQFRLTRRVAGKSVTETFPNPAALRKAQHEVAEFHRFQKLGEDLVSINEKICALRPVEKQRGGWTDQEKKRLLQSIRKSRAR
jgi:hypothetical protein